MSAPRLEVDLDKIHHNAESLVDRLAPRRISVLGVTKATLGSPDIANTLLHAGVTGLGDARIENIVSLRRGGVSATMTLLRSPMISEADQVVASADVSFNTELDVVNELSAAAKRAGRTHGIVLMVELGDLREGIMPDDLHSVVRRMQYLPNITLKGIGTNLACLNGIAPDAEKMDVLSCLAQGVEEKAGIVLDVVSGGNSASLDWALSGGHRGRINELRLGESLLLGREPLRRQPIDGLHTDAFELVAEVIESKIKPSLPWGEMGQTAFGEIVQTANEDAGHTLRAILALGHQDTDPNGLCAPEGLEVVGASSDHLVVNSGGAGPSVGEEVRFQLNYSALLRAMTSPFVTKVIKMPRVQSSPVLSP